MVSLVVVTCGVIGGTVLRPGSAMVLCIALDVGYVECSILSGIHFAIPHTSR